MLGEAMRKAEELYMKHIYATGGVESKQENETSTEVVINKVTTQKAGQYSHRPWRNKDIFKGNPRKTEKVARSQQTWRVFKDNCQEVLTPR